MKKRLYWNSCSYLDTDAILKSPSPLLEFFNSPDIEPHQPIPEELRSHKASLGGSSNEAIFRRTIIDCSKNHFDFALIAWSHPERFFLPNIREKLDYDELKKDSDKQFFGTHWNDQPYGYEQHIPYHNGLGAEILKLEPKGTDDTIFYTLALHNFFQNKGIPHLFLNMGKLDKNILTARKSWLEFINPKNYLSLNNDDDILQKMQFSFVEYYLNKAGLNFMNDKQKAELDKKTSGGMKYSDEFKNSWVVDVAGHLATLGINDLSNKIHKHIVKNNLIKLDLVQ